MHLWLLFVMVTCASCLLKYFLVTFSFLRFWGDMCLFCCCSSLCVCSSMCVLLLYHSYLLSKLLFGFIRFDGRILFCYNQSLIYSLNAMNNSWLIIYLCSLNKAAILCPISQLKCNEQIELLFFNLFKQLNK